MRMHEGNERQNTPHLHSIHGHLIVEEEGTVELDEVRGASTGKVDFALIKELGAVWTCKRVECVCE